MVIPIPFSVQDKVVEPFDLESVPVVPRSPTCCPPLPGKFARGFPSALVKLVLPFV